MLARYGTFAKNNSLLIHDFVVDILSFKCYKITFIFSIPLKHSESTNLSTKALSASNTNSHIHSNNSNIINIHGNYQSLSRDEFRIIIRTEPRIGGCWIKLNSVQPIDINQSKWKVEYLVELTKPKNFIILTMNVEYLHQYYSCKYRLLTNKENAVSNSLYQCLERNWNLDLPKELYNIIKDYSPGIFWEFGEPWLVIVNHLPLFSSVSFSTSVMWTQGVYIENKIPQKIVYCTIESITENFSPSQIKPEPHGDFMLWIRDSKSKTRTKRIK